MLADAKLQQYQLFERVYDDGCHDLFHEENTVRVTLSSLRKRLEDRLQQQSMLGVVESMVRPIWLADRCPSLSAAASISPPQMLDPNIFTLDLHGGPISEVNAVYDRGVVMAFSANFATYAALASATIPAGQLCDRLAAGKLRIGSPAGRITVDLRGDIDNGNGFYVGLHGSIMRMVLRDYAGLSQHRAGPRQFRCVEYAADLGNGSVFGAGDQSTVADVIDAIAFSCGAIAGQDRSGLFRVKRLDAPGQLAALDLYRPRHL